MLADQSPLAHLQLEIDPEIYAKLPLTYVLGDRHALYPLMQAAGAL